MRHSLCNDQNLVRKRFRLYHEMYSILYCLKLSLKMRSLVSNGFFEGVFIFCIVLIFDVFSFAILAARQDISAPLIYDSCT